MAGLVIGEVDAKFLALTIVELKTVGNILGLVRGSASNSVGVTVSKVGEIVDKGDLEAKVTE